MAHGLAGKRRPMGNNELAAAPPRERGMLGYVANPVHVGGGEHRMHAAHLPRSGSVDGTDIGEGMRRAHERGVELARHWRIGGIAASPTQQGLVLQAPLRGRPARISVAVHVDSG